MADFHSFKNLKDPCFCPIRRQCKYTASCEQILGVLKKFSHMKTSTLRYEFGVAPPCQIQTYLYHDI